MWKYHTGLSPGRECVCENRLRITSRTPQFVPLWISQQASGSPPWTRRHSHNNPSWANNAQTLFWKASPTSRNLNKIAYSASISASKHLSKKKIQTQTKVTYLSSFPRCTWTTWPPMRRMRWKWGVPPGALEYPHHLCLYSWHQVSRGWEKTAPRRMVGDEGCVFATRYK